MWLFFLIFSFPYKKAPLTFMSRGLWIMSWRWLTLTWVTPHYHQREEVSLLSSGRDQVVHSCYGRQHNCLWTCSGLSYSAFACNALLGSKWVINRLAIGSEFYCLALTKSRSVWIDWLDLNRLSIQPQLFGCCIVKPHEQLVLVSFTYRYASTSNLSTS